MRRFFRFLMRHRIITTACALGMIGITIFVLVWFQPQKLFIDKTVEEALPPALVEATAPAMPHQPQATVVARGEFISRGHGTSGTATVYRQPDGSLLLRLDRISTSNGPDLRVRLSRHDVHASNGDI